MCTHRVNSSVQYRMSSDRVSLGQTGGGEIRPKSKAALSRRSPDVEGMVDVCGAERLRHPVLARKRAGNEKNVSMS